MTDDPRLTALALGELDALDELDALAQRDGLGELPALEDDPVAHAELEAIRRTADLVREALEASSDVASSDVASSDVAATASAVPRLALSPRALGVALAAAAAILLAILVGREAGRGPLEAHKLWLPAPEAPLAPPAPAMAERDPGAE